MIQTTLIALGGQTASGKSQMAVELAMELKDCWIISCDSRQVYKYLDLGTGKVEGQWEAVVYENQLMHTFLYKGVPHFFIDTIDPSKQYTLAHFLADFRDFCSQHTLPKYLILCGGTGLYIKAIIERYNLSQTKPEFEDVYEQTKVELQSLSLPELQKINQTLTTVPKLNESDQQNPRRLINQILTSKGESLNWGEQVVLPSFEKVYNFAIERDQDQLNEKIETRILTRIDQGMIQEIESLVYLGAERLLSLGLEYRLTYLYLLGQLSYGEYINKLNIESINYSQRQLTWLQKQNLTWVRSVADILNSIQ
jgi:tRNA dimethylallyltransferase